MSDLPALKQAVLDAENSIKSVNPRAFQELKALAKPPACLALTCTASKLLIDRPNAAAGADADGMTFGSSATVVLVGWPMKNGPVRELLNKHVHQNPPADEVLAELKKMRAENAEVWTVENAQRGFEAGAVVLKWIFAVMDCCEKCKEAGEPIQVPTAW